eukprot:TRINITY_DN26670_c0_g2_i4.p4 TRINITY_DN26670_c0_g2~~TRINITY_DN26670_c0_g2_i4.p4  ORF type:complete len:107 (-),score=13.60 TRINITY_DN26670_c0_g2_i4:79-399(-)
MEGAMSGRQLMRCVHRGVLCVAVAGLLVSAAISSLVTDWATPPTRKQVASVLLRVGMHPETLAAAGATPGELAAVFASAEEYESKNDKNKRKERKIKKMKDRDLEQ